MSYIIEFKIKIIDYINSINDPNTAKKEKAKLKMKYNIPKNTMNDWFRDIQKFKYAIKTGKKNYQGGGRKSKLINLKNELLYYILDVKRSGKLLLLIQSLLIFIQ